MCIDKRYDFPAIHVLAVERRNTTQIARKVVNQLKRKRIPAYRARRLVVQRTTPKMNRFRRLLTRREKKEGENYSQFSI